MSVYFIVDSAKTFGGGHEHVGVTHGSLGSISVSTEEGT